MLTELGRKLYDLREDNPGLHRALARHLLLSRNGMNLIHYIQDMQAAAETVDLVRLRKALQQREIHVPSDGKHPSIMKLWLEKAGVFSGLRQPQPAE
jgi:site-specific DNA-methyltransferase (cytosine-N4-specific)